MAIVLVNELCSTRELVCAYQYFARHFVYGVVHRKRVKIGKRQMGEIKRKRGAGRWGSNQTLTPSPIRNGVEIDVETSGILNLTLRCLNAQDVFLGKVRG